LQEVGLRCLVSSPLLQEVSVAHIAPGYRSSGLLLEI
jgi:hypothetical protein